MVILELHKVQQTDDCLVVHALLEDAALMHHATLYDPPEFGPGLCHATVLVDPDERVVDWNEAEIICYLESTQPDWHPLHQDWSDDYVEEEI